MVELRLRSLDHALDLVHVSFHVGRQAERVTARLKRVLGLFLALEVSVVFVLLSRQLLYSLGDLRSGRPRGSLHVQALLSWRLLETRD